MAEQPPPYGAQPGDEKQGYPPPQQANIPPPQGYVPPAQGYAPPPQGYAPPATNTTVVVGGAAPAQTIIVNKRERFADKICLNIFLTLVFWPWAIIWIILCFVEKEN